MVQAVIPVIGYLGAGKSSFIARAQDVGIGTTTQTRFNDEADVCFWELAPDQEPALEKSPFPDLPTCKPVVLIDAVNFRAVSRDPDVGPWLIAMMREASVVLVNKTDLGDFAATQNALRQVGIEAVMNAQDETAVRNAVSAALQTADVTASTVIAKPVTLCRWMYNGAAQLQMQSLDSVLENRPKGAFRITGVIRTETRGMEVEIAGRARQTREVPMPEETVLRSTGLRSDLRPADLDVWFTQAVVDSAHGLGGIACR